MSTENNNNGESNSKRGRYEMESSQSSNSSLLLIVSDEIDLVGNNENISRPFSEQNKNSDNENASKLLEMMLEMKMMRSQLKMLTERLDDIQVKHAADDMRHFVSVDYSEHDLVLTTVDDVNDFESKLKSKDFKTFVLNTLQRIGGTTGNMDAKKVVRAVFSTLFDDELKKKYTWTGFGGRAAFKHLNEIRKLIFEVVVQADSRYSLMQCDYDITHKLLKSKRPSNGRAPLNLSQQNNDVSANSQTLNGSSGAINPISQSTPKAMTPTRLLNPNINVSEAWAYLLGSAYSPVN